MNSAMKQRPSWLLRTPEGWPLRVHHPALAEDIAPFLEAGALAASDIAVLDAAAARFDLAADPAIALAFAFALAAPRQGHLGADLLSLPERVGGERIRTETAQGEPLDLTDRWPVSLEDWQQAVRQHPEVGSPQQPGDKPFIFQPRARADGRPGGLLMTHRMWRQQQRLAEALIGLTETAPDWTPAGEALPERLDAVYGPEDPGNREARAAAAAVVRGRLTVITGGPGTGKTWGIKRVLAILLQAAAQEGRALSIELAAPTGKAAVRMAEALAEEQRLQGVDAQTLERLVALQPRTLHKLMGVLPHRPHAFRHGKGLRLGADVVVVDEASMIDVVMMRHLVEAIAEGKRLILLGDRDQLASVDAGTVLADVVSGVFAAGGSAHRPALARAIAHLTTSHRFKQAASVACVAEGLQLRDEAGLSDAVSLLCGEVPARARWQARLAADPHESAQRCARLTWLTPQPPTAVPDPGQKVRSRTIDERLPEEVLEALASPYLDARVDNLRHGPAGGEHGPQPGYVALLLDRIAAHRSLLDPAFHHQLLDALDRYRILTPHRRGPRGVAGLNQWLTRRIQDALLAASGGGDPSRGKLRKAGAHWVGRPIIVTQNSYEVGLRNGDVGLVVPRATGEGNSEIVVAFPSVATAGALRPPPRYIPLARLPQHESALAMTVHKSQGSQFERVALVLPAQAASPILTRELIYTGVTRAKWRVDWAGGREVLQQAVRRDVSRASGLDALLWQPAP